MCFLFLLRSVEYFVFVAVAAQDGPEAGAVLSVPVDITPYGTLKNIQSQKLNLPSGYRFPATDKRKFNQKWLEDFVWLEYSLSKNAVFCYACLQFSPVHERDNLFKSTGFSNWKIALESKKGFKKHQSCKMHTISMAKWSEAIERQKNNSSVYAMVSDNILECRRNYMKKIIEVIYL